MGDSAAKATDLVAMTDAWVRELATSPLVGTRRRLLREVCACCEPLRPAWLDVLARDGDTQVRRAASEALIQSKRDEPDRAFIEELDARFADGPMPSGVSWEWEFVSSVWLPREGPRSRIVFLPKRDLPGARERAIGEWDEFGEPIVPSKGGVFLHSVRLVCEYTRSPRSMNEALRWKNEGRPGPPSG